MTWVKACRKSQLENNQKFNFDLEQLKLLLMNIDGTIYATDRTCTHADADLSIGVLSCEGITCPLHLSVFNPEDGMPKNPPAEQPLKTYKTKIDNEEIFVEV